MIESLGLAGLAAFGASAEPFGPLSTLNFVFGPNGSGKTSISRQFSAIDGSPELAIWVDSDRLDRWVFNRDYVEKTFQQDRDLPGVFVLGSQSAEALAERERLTDERGELRTKIVRIQNGLGSVGEESVERSGKRGELATVNDTLAAAAWEEKQKLSGTFKELFAGFNASRSVLLAEVLRVRGLSPAAEAGEVAGEAPADERPADILAHFASRLKVLQVGGEGDLELIELPSELLQGDLPKSDLMAKSIVGRSDAAVAALIKKLSNSDWVAEGQAHLPHSEGLCPFCQQRLPDGFSEQLIEYFDRGFEQDLAGLRLHAAAVDEFLANMAAVVSALVDLDDDLSDVTERSELVREVEDLSRGVRVTLAKKVESPALVVDLPVGKVTVGSLVAAHKKAEAAIENRRSLLADRVRAMQVLREDLWQFFVHERLSAALDVYDAARAPLESAIKGMEDRLGALEKDLQDVNASIRDLSRKVVSSEPVIENINSMLDAVGFGGFYLAASEQLDDGYRLIRESGEVVGHTLSEGERSFVTFLYFVSQIEGVHPDAGLAANTSVIIDDPISSLDSEALFFVSTYLRELFAKVVEGATNVKQVVVMTHNVYFHKELTYNIEKLCGGRHVQHFGIVKRRSDGNVIVRHDSNPVTTAYDGLWKQVRSAMNGEDVPGVQNAMRRIIESYFQFVGQPLIRDLPASFAGTDRLICKSLVSWVHDGSHATSLLDAVDYSHAGGSVQQWLAVFEQLFEMAGHPLHFEAMTE